MDRFSPDVTIKRLFNEYTENSTNVINFNH